jgi:site-specific DNA-methyltransferase (adenine-specific)
MELIHGDCLEKMKTIPDQSIDMILCDLPYGTTACKWDVVIPFELLWEQYKRIIKDHRAIILFGSEPFSSHLRMSNLQWFKYDWYWRKSRPSGYVNAKLKPLKDIETISIFSNGYTANGSSENMIYHPQGLRKVDKEWSRPKNYMSGDKGVNPARESNQLSRVIENEGYPRQVLDFKNQNNNVIHPTQKPVDLCEYLILTYSNEGETVLDNCMGSGSTGVACINTKRNFIGIEKDDNYFEIAKNRIEEQYKLNKIDKEHKQKIK